MITRREFTALMGAGFLFPRELLSSEKDNFSEPIADSYPIYYMRTGDKDVYQLWQPGIVLGILSGGIENNDENFYSNGKDVIFNGEQNRSVRLYTKIEDSYGMPDLALFAPPAVFVIAGRRTLSGMSKISLIDAFTSACPHNLIIDDGFARPYALSSAHQGSPGAGGLWANQSSRYQPALIHLGDAETLVGKGHLLPCKPHCTFKQLLADSDLGANHV